MIIILYTYEKKIRALQIYDEIGSAAELKLEILHRCFELGEDVKSVENEVGYSRASIYAWRRKYLREETISLMNHNDVPRGKLNPDVSSSFEEINELRSKIQDMQMEIDILKETNQSTKKALCVSMVILKNSEKAVIVDALKERYLLLLLLLLALPKSSYYYQKSSIKKIDKYAETRCCKTAAGTVYVPERVFTR